MADFKGGFTFKIGDGAGSEVFTALEGMRGAPQIGKTNPYYRNIGKKKPTSGNEVGLTVLYLKKF